MRLPVCQTEEKIKAFHGRAIKSNPKHKKPFAKIFWERETLREAVEVFVGKDGSLFARGEESFTDF